jgi:hypothetical protein
MKDGSTSPPMRVLLIPLVVLITLAYTLELKQCKQQILPVPGSRKGASVLGRYALFAMTSHSDDPNSGRVDIYDAETHAWSQTNLSTSRTNMCSTSWQHLAIFAGGATARGQPKSSSIDVFDTSTGKWSLLELAMGRDLLACASAGNYTIFAGGSAPQVNQSETLSVEIWNHITGEWTHGALSQPRKKPEAVAVGSRIVIAGGEIAKPKPPGSLGDDIGGYSATMDIFDTVTGEWSTAALDGARQYFGAAHASGKAVGASPAGMAVFAGGFFNDVRLGDVDMYDPVADVHHTGSTLSHNRSNLQGASVGVGGRYCAFGSGNIDSVAKVNPTALYRHC